MRWIAVFEPEGAQQGNQLDFVFLVGGKLDEADALDGGPFRHRRPGHAADAEMAAHLIAKIDQRAVAVGGNRPRQTASKLVVEDLREKYPSYPVAATASVKAVTGRSPSPGIFRKWRLQ